ncbi:MAG: hypothetical protein ABIJ34_08070 [archaeon]
METTKWAKRIAALGTGVLMLGATLSGALAVNDLANYPVPFVKNGMLDDTVIVVGKAAKSEDVLGAVDIAAALQAEAVSKTSVDVATAVAPTTDKGIKIEKSGNKYNYGEQISDLQPSSLDGNDLVMLGDGTFVDNKGDNKDDVDFQQDLVFGQIANEVFELMFTQPHDNDNYPDGLPAGDYLYADKGNWLYNYTLSFDSDVDVSAAADLEGNSIELQGNTYTITEASLTSTYVSKIKLVAGDSTVWLVQDQPYTVGSHTVTVVDVDSGETKCGVNVDGVTKWVDEGTTETFGDMSVGVLDVIAVNTKDYNADTCELTLGSNEIVLENGEAVTVNGDTLEGSEVTMTNGAAANTWAGFVVKYKLGEDSGLNQDAVYLAKGEAWTDPVFGNFKVQFEGVTATRETMKIKTSSEDAEFTFVNNDGKDVSIPFHYASGVVSLGKDTDENLLLPGQTYSADPEKQMLLYTTSGGEVHVLRIDDVTCSASTNKTTIKDLTYGVTVASAVELANDCNGVETISLGSLGSISLSLKANAVNYTDSASMGGGWPETKYEGKLNFTENGLNPVVRFLEYNDDITPQVVTFNVSYDSGTDETVEVSDVKIDGTTPTWVDIDENDDNTQMAYTNKGSLLKVDQEDDLWLEIQHAEKDAYGNVFVVPLDATVTEGGSGSVMADKVNPFTVGLAVLDENAASMTKNMILVGGPCANSVAREVMGATMDTCADGFESGKAKIKFFERNGKAALLVAGDRAEDTRGASYVLADHKKYALSGEEVEVVVASLSDIKVSKVA